MGYEGWETGCNGIFQESFSGLMDRTQRDILQDQCMATCFAETYGIL